MTWLCRCDDVFPRFQLERRNARDHRVAECVDSRKRMSLERAPRASRGCPTSARKTILTLLDGESQWPNCNVNGAIWRARAGALCTLKLLADEGGQSNVPNSESSC